MPSQLVLPLPEQSSQSRQDFIVTETNAKAVAFIDSWPDWTVGVAVICGPNGSGKSHLADIWRAASGATIISARDLARMSDPAVAPRVIEDLDTSEADSARDAALFSLFERASPQAPLLLTAREPPSNWTYSLPDLASRFSALLAFPLWASDDDLLTALARKLFADKQLNVPDAVITRMLHSLERSPGAFRDFIARADAKALTEARPVNLALIREMLGS